MVQKQTSDKLPKYKPPPTAAKKTSTAQQATKSRANGTVGNAADLKRQQRLLDIFSGAFGAVLASEEFPVLLQEIKQALFNREFGTAFGREDYLEAYAARWSPTRALCYVSVLQAISPHLRGLENTSDAPVGLTVVGDDHQSMPTETKTLSTPSTDPFEGTVTPSDSPSCSEPAQKIKRIRVLSIGGCAAEHVAFASYIHENKLTGDLTLLDSAPWSHVASLTQNQLLKTPSISKYASAAIKATNAPLLRDSQLSYAVSQHDILTLDKDQLSQQLGVEPLLVTLLFTLNELYTNDGIGKTTKFLTSLGDVLPNGSLLLVVDSPGSYSEAAVGKANKRYPMQWLLNHTLLETKTSDQKFEWERLESEDSTWFRLPDGVSYPIPLENMRYQMHLYRIKRAS